MKGETEDKSSANVEIGLHQLDWHLSTFGICPASRCGTSKHG